MKYTTSRIVILIIIISLGQILLSYIANTSRTHARTHARTHSPTHRCRLQVVAVRLVGGAQPWQNYVPFRLFHWRSMAGRCFIQIKSRGRLSIRDSFGCFSHIKKIRGRTETPTRDRMDCHLIRTVWDISLDDWARIGTCSLLASTDRFK